MTAQTIIAKLAGRHHKNSRDTNVNLENIDYVSYILMYVQEALLLFGAFPSNSKYSTKFMKVYKIFINFIIYLVIGFVLVAALLNLTLCDEETIVRLKKCPLLMIHCMGALKYTYILNNRRKLEHCLKMLEEDWENMPGARHLMMSSAKFTRRFILLNIFITDITFVFNRMFLPLYVRRTYIAHNITNRVPLPFPTFLFSIDIQATPIYEIIYTIDIICILILTTLTVSSCGITVGYILHGCSQVKHLSCLMVSFVQKQWTNETDLTKSLASLIEYHVRIRKYLNKLNASLGFLILVEIGGGTLTLCIVAFTLISEFEESHAITLIVLCVVLMAAAADIFCFCYVGNLLIKETDQLHITSRILEWYRLPIKKARAVILLMLLCSAPLKITVGGIFELSMKLYGDMIKTAVAYLNMFRAVT